MVKLLIRFLHFIIIFLERKKKANASNKFPKRIRFINQRLRYAYFERKGMQNKILDMF